METIKQIVYSDNIYTIEKEIINNYIFFLLRDSKKVIVFYMKNLSLFYTSEIEKYIELINIELSCNRKINTLNIYDFIKLFIDEKLAKMIYNKCNFNINERFTTILEIFHKCNEIIDDIINDKLELYKNKFLLYKMIETL